MSGPSDFFQYQDGELRSGGVSLSKIAMQIGTPAYVYSAEALLSPIRSLKAGLRGLDFLICFAMKANSNLAVLKLLAKSGAGMDLVSGGELFRAKLAGVASERIVFSGVGKTDQEIEEALQQRIFSFNVESIAELDAINRVASSLNCTAPIALRFNPDVNARTHPYISTGLKKNKFGLQRGEILAIAKLLGEKRSTKYSSIMLRGISIHIGSQILDLSPLSDSFTRTRILAGEVEKILGESLRFIDLGGGLGIDYGRGESPSIEDYCALIQKIFGPKSESKGRYKILLEPGRLISANAGVLLTRVLYRKPRKAKDFLVVDAGMNDLLRPALYQSHHQIAPVRKTSARQLRLTDVVGPVCETADCFASGIRLPKNLKAGDLLTIRSSGAYGFTMASNYNTRPRPAEVMIEKGRFRVVRKRETYEDLVRGENI